jgi:hypothetical protein
MLHTLKQKLKHVVIDFLSVVWFIVNIRSQRKGEYYGKSISYAYCARVFDNHDRAVGKYDY